MLKRIVIHGVAMVMVTVGVFTPASVAAQTDAGSNEMTVFAGASLIGVEERDSDRFFLLGRGDFRPEIYPGPFRASRSLDGSFELGVRYDRFVTDRVAVGGDFSVAPSHRLTETLRFGCPDGRLCALPALLVPDQQRVERLAAYHYGANIGIDVLGGPVRPSVIAGLGAVTYDGIGLSSTSLAVRFGAGLRAGAGPVSARLEVLDVITPDHAVTARAEHDVHVRVGLGVRW